MRLRYAAVVTVGAAVVATALSAPLNPAAATLTPGTVTGILTYPDGRPATGKPIELVALPPGDAVAESQLTQVTVDSTTTDALGRYTLTASSASASVLSLAQSANDVLDATIRAVWEEAPLVEGAERDATVHMALYGVTFDLVNDPVSGQIFVGEETTVDLTSRVASTSVTVTGTDVTASATVPNAGLTASASPQPEPDTETGAEPTVDNAVTAASEAQDTVDDTGVPTGDVVDVDSTTVDTLVDAAGNATGTSEILSEIRSDPEGGSGDPHRYPSNPCPDDYYSDSIRYPMTYLTYSFPAWVTVGEMHVPTDTIGRFKYTTSSKTTVKRGFQFNGDGWSVGGYTSPSRQVSAWNGWRQETTTAMWARHIKARYRFHDTRTYYCKGSPQGSVVYSTYDERLPKYWETAITVGSVDLRNWDSRTRFDAARERGHAARFYKSNIPGHSSGDGYNYSFETCVLGLCIGSETDYSAETTTEWDFKGHRDWYWLFGNDNTPLYARITYAYG